MRWFRRYIEKIATEVAGKLIKEHEMARREQMTIGQLEAEDINVSGGCTVAGQLAADGDAAVAGSLDVNGAVTVQELSAAGVFMLSNLPTSDPGSIGQIWNNGGVLTVSAS